MGSCAPQLQQGEQLQRRLDWMVKEAPGRLVPVQLLLEEAVIKPVKERVSVESAPGWDVCQLRLGCVSAANHRLALLCVSYVVLAQHVCGYQMAYTPAALQLPAACRWSLCIDIHRYEALMTECLHG